MSLSKTKLFLAGAALGASFLAAAPASATDFSACVTGVARSDVLNVRVRPDARSPVVSFFRPGACGIAIEHCTANWCFTQNGEFEGWMRRKFLVAEGDGGTSATCGWFVFLGTSESRAGAAAQRSRIDPDRETRLIRNSDFPNLTPGFWSVALGPFTSKGRALRTADGWRADVPDAFVKSGC